MNTHESQVQGAMPSDERAVEPERRVVPRALDEWVKDRLRKQAEEIARDVYAESNRETEKLTGIGLGAFGYQI